LIRWVPAGSGNRRVVEKALAALPGGIDKIDLRGDSALYPALAVHADHNPVPFQAAGEVVAGELAALVGIEDLRPTVAWKAETYVDLVDARSGRSGQLRTARRRVAGNSGQPPCLPGHAIEARSRAATAGSSSSRLDLPKPG
jgi:hypothetical protein